MPRASYYEKHADELRQKERERYWQTRQTETIQRTVQPKTKPKEFSCIYCDDHLSPYSEVDFVFHLKALHRFSHEEALEVVKELIAEGE